jgi:hypothetical protein
MALVLRPIPDSQDRQVLHGEWQVGQGGLFEGERPWIDRATRRLRSYG